jgi:hypothetical protein
VILQFERGQRDEPVGHALIYFRDGDEVLATYVSVPPIEFDLANYMPPFLQNAMQGMDMGEAGTVATPIPPIPEPVESHEYLVALAERRHDDLVSAGSGNRANPMQMAAETAEAARSYGDLYQSSLHASPLDRTPASSPQTSRFAGMPQQEQLNELTHLTGRLLDSLGSAEPAQEIVREMQELAALLPAKYRIPELIAAAMQPGERGTKLADLYLKRSYKLYHEEYLDLERLDREIAAIQG